MSSRRSFLGKCIGLTGVLTKAGAVPTRANVSPAREMPRQQAAFAVRQRAAVFQAAQVIGEHLVNGDEAAIPAYLACFSKGLPHARTGEVQTDAYEALLDALSSGKPQGFERIPMGGGGTLLVNPQAAFAYELEGADSHRFAIPPAPSFGSAETAAEMVELYWQALLRDIPFDSYAASPLAQAAAAELALLDRGSLSRLGPVTVDTLFRVNATGVAVGPYVSQFLWKPVPVNSTIVDQRYRVPIPGTNYLDTYADWYFAQSGLAPTRQADFAPQQQYLITGRMLAEWVHYDFLYQAFHNAALILLNQGPATIGQQNTYLHPANPYQGSRVQTGFSTFGAAHICCLLGHAALSALHAAWFQKWAVHRRLRPEEFGGRVHQIKTGVAQYPVHPALLNSAALAATFRAQGSYLLPQTYPEGAPLHPSYPAGHATVAGACSALLKAFFDESATLNECVMPTADGLLLVPYDGPPLTVGGEVNKLAANIAMGRDFAGIHYRSDAEAGFRLGEDIAISLLQDMIETLTEDFAGFQFTRIDGTFVHIEKRRPMR